MTIRDNIEGKVKVEHQTTLVVGAFTTVEEIMAHLKTIPGKAKLSFVSIENMQGDEYGFLVEQDEGPEDDDLKYVSISFEH